MLAHDDGNRPLRRRRPAAETAFVVAHARKLSGRERPAKALGKAVRDVAGPRALVRRCQIHKSRNVCGHLPDRERAWVRAKLRTAWTDTDHARALASLKALAAQLEKVHRDAAGSLREAMEETLTLIRLGVSGTLRRTLSSTNCIESTFDTAAYTHSGPAVARNVQ